MITIPAVILSVFVGALAAFPLSHTRIPGERYLFLLLLAGMLVPQQTVQIPLFLIMRALRLYNTIPGMWLVHVAYGVPFCAFFMRNFFSSMPRSMFEAAESMAAVRLATSSKSCYPRQPPAWRRSRLSEPLGLERSVLWPDHHKRPVNAPGARCPLQPDRRARS